MNVSPEIILQVERIAFLLLPIFIVFLSIIASFFSIRQIIVIWKKSNEGYRTQADWIYRRNPRYYFKRRSTTRTAFDLLDEVSGGSITESLTKVDDSVLTKKYDIYADKFTSSFKWMIIGGFSIFLGYYTVSLLIQTYGK